MKPDVSITCLLITVGALLWCPGPAAAAQRVSCAAVTNVRDAAQCIGSTPALPVQELKHDHIYTLPELIDLAESNSPEGRIAWTRAKMSLEQAGIARASYLPVLAFAAQGSDVRAIVPFPKPLAPRGYVTVEQPVAAAQMELEYTLLNFARGPKLEAAKATELAGALTLSRTQQQIAYNVAALYYREQLEAGRLAAAKTILQDAETLRDNAQSQFDNGRTTLPDLQNAQAGVAEARFSLAAAEGAVKKAKIALTEAVGVEPSVEIELPVQADDVSSDVVDSKVEELIQAAWSSRPDLLARAQALKRAQQNTRVAHAAYLPSARLAGTGGQTATWPTADFGQLGYANVTTWSAALSLKWEIFNGARKHEVAATLAEQRAAAEEQRATKDRVTREVWQSYVDYQTAEEQQKAAQSFLASSQISYDSSLDAFRYGVRSLVDVVQAEKQLAQARLAVVDANAQVALSAAALNFAVGARP
ncbi:TolC family protein [Terriglobus sp. RCC_193]|uniref:TolC family protein n=1 Tax=Terriglobus sp. RCC_193 TaxID=3239218 RepID=UPI0035261357